VEPTDTEAAAVAC